MEQTLEDREQYLKELSKKYQDPENMQEIIDEIKEAPTLGDVNLIVNKYFPDWIITYMEVYCPDYPHLQDNWKKLCTLMETQQAQIMIVELIDFDDNHKLTRMICELFTRCGFCVKRKQEFFPCANCGSAVPSEFIYDKFKKQGNDVPDVYSQRCKGCQ